MTSTTIEPTAGATTTSAFADMRLRPETLRALDGMGIVEPTPIQAATIPALLDGRDVVGQARTGSGKTLAFGLPAMESVDPARRQVQVLVLTPTRELAVQVGGVLEQVGAPRRIAVGLIFGGRALGPQRDLLRRGVHVVVGTPGRVLDLLNQGALWLDKVRFLVLDEADEMLDRGFAPDVERILARTSSARQTALFSATVPDWVRQTAARHLNDPVEVAVDPDPEDAAPIEHVAFDVASGDKLGALRDLLDHRPEGSIIVFGRTKHGVKKLARQLDQAGYPVAALQGNLSQNARDKVMEDFRSGRVPILLATNVAARGIDVTSIAQVINFELPESSELLTHRVGRTGRMGRRGQAITLLGPDDGTKWRQLERGLGRRIPRAPWRGARAVVAGVPPAERASRSPDRTAAIPVAAPARREPAPAPAPRHARSAHAAAPRPRPQERVETSDWLLPTGDGVTADLLAQHGHDPRRPTWAAGQNGGGERAARRRPRRTGRERGQEQEQEHGHEHEHEIVCAACGRPAQVSFQPDPTRPVFCNDCYRARHPRRTTPRDAVRVERAGVQAEA